MYTRVLSYLFPASKEVNAVKAIDFNVTSFDPANRAHRECIDAKINNLNKTYNLLVKTDIIIIVPFAMDILLMIGRVLGLGMSLLVCAGICSVLYASEQFQNHLKHQKQFHGQLAELLDIWRSSVKQKGADITDDQTILKIVRAIAPFLESEPLVNWRPNQTYPDPNFSDKFVEILSATPHKIPRIMLKGSVPVKTEETQISQAGLLRVLTNATASNRWVDLYKSSMANLNFTMYGYKPKKEEEEKVQSGILQMLKL